MQVRRCGESTRVKTNDRCPDLDQHDYFTGGPLEGYVLPLEADCANVIDATGQTVVNADNAEHAQFLARAVNAHDALVGLVKRGLAKGKLPKKEALAALHLAEAEATKLIQGR